MGSFNAHCQCFKIIYIYISYNTPLPCSVSFFSLLVWYFSGLLEEKLFIDKGKRYTQNTSTANVIRTLHKYTTHLHTHHTISHMIYVYSLTYIHTSYIGCRDRSIWNCFSYTYILTFLLSISDQIIKDFFQQQKKPQQFSTIIE